MPNYFSYIISCPPCNYRHFHSMENTFFTQFSSVQPISYLNGTVSRDDYISRFRSEYPVILYANQHLPMDSKTLCLFLGDRGYYMDFQHRFAEPNNTYDDNIFFLSSKKQPKQSRSPYTHLITRDDLTTSWINNLGSDNRAISVDFFSYNLNLLYRKNGYSLFEIIY